MAKLSRTIFAVLTTTWCVVDAGAQPVWKPEKATEMVVINAPGGGSDRTARIMSAVMRDKKIVDVPLNVVNKPGGGGNVAYSYLSQRPPDGHYLSVGGKSIMTNHIAGRGLSYTEFTAVAHLFGEYISIVVKPDSPLKSGRELVERLKKDPAALSLGIATSLGNPNHQGVAAALKVAGIDIRKTRNVIFQSGGEATTALLGGHVDAVPITAAFAASLARSGQVRVIAVTSPQRLPGVLAEVPTWREQGLDAVVSNWRNVIGPKGMSDAQVTFWEEAFRRMTESDEWKKELETNFWTSEFMRHTETRKAMDRDYALLRIFMTELGLAK
jgi:putative tricarboxylic transport membrane protein